VLALVQRLGARVNRRTGEFIVDCGADLPNLDFVINGQTYALEVRRGDDDDNDGDDVSDGGGGGPFLFKHDMPSVRPRKPLPNTTAVCPPGQPKDYVLQDEESNTCALAIMPLDAQAVGGPIWILGDVFM
jgi:hypothetical protein